MNAIEIRKILAKNPRTLFVVKDSGKDRPVLVELIGFGHWILSDRYREQKREHEAAHPSEDFRRATRREDWQAVTVHRYTPYGTRVRNREWLGRIHQKDVPREEWAISVFSGHHIRHTLEEEQQYDEHAAEILRERQTAAARRAEAAAALQRLLTRFSLPIDGVDAYEGAPGVLRVYLPQTPEGVEDFLAKITHLEDTDDGT